MGLAIAISVSLITGCGGEETADKEENMSEEASENEEETTDQQPEMPDPDLESIPDVVAEVNGSEITKDQFEPIYVSTLNNYAMQGMYDEEQDENGEMAKQIQQQIVDQMIGQELLIQEASQRELQASDEELNEKLASLKEQFESDEQYEEALESSNVSEEDLIEDIQTQIKVEKLVAEETGEIEIPEEDIKESYDQMTEMQGEGENIPEFPSYEEMKPQLENRLRAQKENEEIEKIIDDLRKKADVEVHM